MSVSLISAIGFVGSYAKDVCSSLKSLSIYNVYIYIYVVFTTEEFLEVAIESWPEWDLNPRPLNSVQTV